MAILHMLLFMRVPIVISFAPGRLSGAKKQISTWMGAAIS